MFSAFAGRKPRALSHPSGLFKVRHVPALVFGLQQQSHLRHKIAALSLSNANFQDGASSNVRLVARPLNFASKRACFGLGKKQTGAELIQFNKFTSIRGDVRRKSNPASRYGLGWVIDSCRDVLISLRRFHGAIFEASRLLNSRGHSGPGSKMALGCRGHRIGLRHFAPKVRKIY